MPTSYWLNFFVLVTVHSQLIAGDPPSGRPYFHQRPEPASEHATSGSRSRAPLPPVDDCSLNLPLSADAAARLEKVLKPPQEPPFSISLKKDETTGETKSVQMKYKNGNGAQCGVRITDTKNGQDILSNLTNDRGEVEVEIKGSEIFVGGKVKVPLRQSGTGAFGVSEVGDGSGKLKFQLEKKFRKKNGWEFILNVSADESLDGNSRGANFSLGITR